MEKLKLKRALVVEGKYDKAKLSSLVEGTILQTDGFRIYRDKQLAAMIRAVARRQGLVILTDSDRAGFQIRHYIRSLAQGADVVNVYIPQTRGKERRKAAPGAEGLLGVEGIDADILRELLQKAGALADEEAPDPDAREARRIGRADLYEDGLTGGPDAAGKRRALLLRLKLPGYLSTAGLLEVINTLMTYSEYRAFCDGEEG